MHVFFHPASAGFYFYYYCFCVWSAKECARQHEARSHLVDCVDIMYYVCML